MNERFDIRWDTARILIRTSTLVIKERRMDKTLLVAMGMLLCALGLVSALGMLVKLRGVLELPYPTDLLALESRQRFCILAVIMIFLGGTLMVAGLVFVLGGLAYIG